MIAPLLLALLAQQDARPWVSLAGNWEARYDADGRGLASGWAAGGPADGWTKIAVPSVLEEYEPFSGKDGVFWLRRTVRIDASPGAQERLRLRFERAVESCKVWMNGTEVGEHDGGDVPFELDVTPAAMAGENTLVVRLTDAKVGGLAGIVKLARVSAITVDDLFAACAPGDAPDVVTLEAEIGSTSAEAKHLEVKAEVVRIPAPRPVVSGSVALDVQPGQSARPALKLKIPEAALWSPSTPVLYAARVVVLSDGVPCDERRVLFGLRSVGVKGTRLLLNGVETRLRCAVDSGYEFSTFLRPGPLLPPEKKLRALREAGFNAICIPGRLAPRALLEAADALGVLVIAQPAAFREEAVKRDRSSPSVIWWGIAGGDDETLRRMAALDPDALVSRDESARAANALLVPGSAAIEPYLRPEIRLGAPLSLADRLRIRDLGDREEFAFAVVSCGVSTGDPDRAIASLGGEAWREEVRALEARRARLKEAFAGDALKPFLDSPAALAEASEIVTATSIKGALEELRANPKLAGYALRWLADSPEHFGEGLFDISGRPRKSAMTAKFANLARRSLLVPDRTCSEASSLGVVSVRTTPLVDDGPPIDIVCIETIRPDKLSGISTLVGDPAMPYWRCSEVGFLGGAGVYSLHPIRKDIEYPDVEEAFVLALEPSERLATEEKPAVVLSRPDAAVALGFGRAAGFGGSGGEDDFLRLAQALEIARAGGTTILLDALTPASPLVALGLLPKLRLVPCDGAFHAISGDAAFDGVGKRGAMSDPFNELVPRFAIADLEKAQPLAVAIDPRGSVLGADLVRVPFGKGTLVLTTMPLGDKYHSDAAARRIAANLVGAAPAAAGFAAPKTRADLETLRARYREFLGKR